MELTEKKRLVFAIRNTDWSDKLKLSETITELCLIYNSQKTTGNILNDEDRISELNNLYCWLGELFSSVMENCNNPIYMGAFWNKMMEEASFYIDDLNMKELSRAILDFYFVKCNNDIAKVLFDKSDERYHLFKRYVIEGIKEIFVNGSKTDMVGFENDFTRLRSHISKSMLADSFNNLNFELYQEKGYCEMFIDILESLVNYLNGEQKKEVSESIVRLIDSQIPSSCFIQTYKDYLKKFS